MKFFFTLLLSFYSLSASAQSDTALESQQFQIMKVWIMGSHELQVQMESPQTKRGMIVNFVYKVNTQLQQEVFIYSLEDGKQIPNTFREMDARQLTLGLLNKPFRADITVYHSGSSATHNAQIDLPKYRQQGAYWLNDGVLTPPLNAMLHLDIELALNQFKGSIRAYGGQCRHIFAL